MKVPDSIRRALNGAAKDIGFVGSGDGASTPVINVDDLPAAAEFLAYAGQTATAPFQASIWDGGKYPGGFGATQLFGTDYWTLRQRSSQLFKENLYARGIIRRLITNEINTGLDPESCPNEAILGVPDQSLSGWTETTEERFLLWAQNPFVCDWNQRETLGAIQAAIRMEALVAGDVLVVLRDSPTSIVPMVQLIPGDRIRTPMITESDGKIPAGHIIRHGIELDKNRRHVAFWIVQEGGIESKRLPARAPKSGRRLAWIVYGTEKRLDDVRGEPLLSILLQSLKEVDRYRDAALRKAVLNAILAMFIKKNEDKVSSMPVSGGARRKDAVTTTDSDGETRTRNFAAFDTPGLIVEELQEGEEPTAHSIQGTDTNFPVFEEAVIGAIAWAMEIPPEILRLVFSNNYASSQAGINEFKVYLNRIWKNFGDSVMTPIWIEWLLSSVLAGRVQADGFLEAWRDNQDDIFGAWTSVIWYGSIKPSTDVVKTAKGTKALVDECWLTNAQAARQTTGTRFATVVKKQTIENQMKADAKRPLAEFEQEFGKSPDEVAANAEDAIDVDAIEALIDDYNEERGIA